MMIVIAMMIMMMRMMVVMIILMIMMMPIGSSQIAEEKNHSALPCRCEIDGNLHLEWEGLVSTPE